MYSTGQHGKDPQMHRLEGKGAREIRTPGLTEISRSSCSHRRQPLFYSLPAAKTQMLNIPRAPRLTKGFSRGLMFWSYGRLPNM